MPHWSRSTSKMKVHNKNMAYTNTEHTENIRTTASIDIQSSTVIQLSRIFLDSPGILPFSQFCPDIQKKDILDLSKDQGKLMSATLQLFNQLLVHLQILIT